MNSKKIVFLAIPFLIVGCSTLPKLSTPPTKEIVAADSFRGASELGSKFNESWWNSFNDPLLSNLIDIATKSNLDLRMAVLKVEEARAGITANDSRLLPSVNIESSVSDSRSGLPRPYKIGAPDVRANRASLNMAWEIDLFGAARESINASKFEAKAATYGLDAVRLMITSEVARNYFIWKDARARLGIA
jgi:outer membrane protein TolC